MINASTIATAADVGDFAYAPMQMQPYVGFDHGLATLPTDRPPLIHHHLYDNLDFAAGAPPFPFQDQPASLLSGAGLQPLASQMTMPMAPSSLQMQMQIPMMAAADVHPFGGGGLVKREDRAVVDVGDGRIGLNLGRRTYFSPADVLAVDRLLMGSRLGGMGVLGLGLGAAAGHHHHQPPRCQAEGCKADLSGAKHYHRRHKVCEYHAKAAAVAAGGKQQRFCQQCSRFHALAEFDEAKRSCRKRLTEHNRRRRKPAGAQAKESSPPSKKADTGITTSYTSDHKTASATVVVAAAAAAISPNASGISCLQELDNGGHASSAAAPAPAPTTLSLAAAALHGKDGGALAPETMLMMQQVQAAAGRGDQDQQQQQQRFVMASLVQATQYSSGGGSNDGGSGNGNVLSCSSVSDHQNSSCSNNNNNSCGMHFFEVDFM